MRLLKGELVFKKNTPVINPALQEAIDLALAELKQHDPDTEQYATILTQIERLNTLATPEKEDKISKDNWLAAGTNLLGIGIIVGYEHAHVVTSKAVGFITKVRL